MFTNTNRNQFFEAATEKTGGSEESKTEKTETISKADVQKIVDEATKGLKTTNEALKLEKVELRKRFDGLEKVLSGIGGEDGAKALLDMKAHLDQSEIGKLLAEGKTDEWLAANVSAIKGEHEQTVTKLNTDITDAVARAERSEGAFANLRLEIAVRDACTTSEGFRPAAVSDALLWANSRFEFDHERGIPVKKDENGTVILGKDGETPMTIAEDLESAKEDRRHWWEGSQGAGAGGNIGGKGGDGPTEIRTLDDWRKHRETQGLKNDEPGKTTFPG